MKNSLYTLDVFRQNDLAYTMCRINYEVGSIEIPFVFNDYFNKTTLDFMNQARQLENPIQCPVAYNVSLLQIYTNYFACFEQFVSTLYEILYYYIKSKVLLDEKESIKLFRQDYIVTIGNILNVTNTPKMEYARTGLSNKIKELENARNYILHGNIGRIKISKTGLPHFPLTINYEDIMEEIDIILNFINLFRYVLPNIDLMPNIQIMIGEAIFFKPFDEYFYKVVCPYFANVLQKHGLNQTRNYTLITKSLKPITNAISDNISIYTKVTPEKLFSIIEMNKQETNYYVRHLHNIIGHDESMKMKGKFQLPKFMLNTESK
jgi:hypothetical protein